MGRVCAWCGTVLRRCSGPGAPVTHAICEGCREELCDALWRSGLRTRTPEDFDAQREAQPH